MSYTPLYPGTTVTFVSQEVTDGVSVVKAQDINPVYGEVIAIANTLGTNPQTRETSWSSGSFGTSTTTNVNDRITNVETGTYKVYNDYISRSSLSGANTIQPVGSTTTVNLTVKPATSQSADLFQAVVGSTVVTRIKADGTFLTSVIDGGSA